MAIEEAPPITDINSEPQDTPAKPLISRRGLILGGVAVAAVGTLSGLEHAITVEQKALDLTIAGRQVLEQSLSSTISSNFLRKGILPPISPDALKAPKKDAFFDALRWVEKNKPEWLPFTFDESLFPNPLRRALSITAEGVTAVNTEDDHINLVLPQDWIQNVFVPIFMTFKGEFGSDIRNLSNAQSEQTVLNLSQAQGTIRDPFETARLKASDPRQIIVTSQTLKDTLQSFINIPQQKTGREDEVRWNQNASVPRPNAPDYLSPGVTVDFKASDGKSVKAALNSLGDLIIYKQLT